HRLVAQHVLAVSLAALAYPDPRARDSAWRPHGVVNEVHGGEPIRALEELVVRDDGALQIPHLPRRCRGAKHGDPCLGLEADLDELVAVLLAGPAKERGPRRGPREASLEEGRRAQQAREFIARGPALLHRPVVERFAV